MLPSHATHAAGGYGTEAGIMEMLTRMRDGRFKVAAHLINWFQEFRTYHRKDGLIVKINDNLMSATRIAVMAHRKARVDDTLGDPQWWREDPRKQRPTNRGGDQPVDRPCCRAMI